MEIIEIVCKLRDKHSWASIFAFMKPQQSIQYVVVEGIVVLVLTEGSKQVNESSFKHTFNKAHPNGFFHSSISFSELVFGSTASIVFCFWLFMRPLFSFFLWRIVFGVSFIGKITVMCVFRCFISQHEYYMAFTEGNILLMCSYFFPCFTLSR